MPKQDFDFLYDQKKGGLYFNENGSDKGFGDGGIIAILKGAPAIDSDNLVLYLIIYGVIKLQKTTCKGMSLMLTAMRIFFGIKIYRAIPCQREAAKIN